MEQKEKALKEVGISVAVATVEASIAILACIGYGILLSVFLGGAATTLGFTVGGGYLFIHAITRMGTRIMAGIGVIGLAFVFVAVGLLALIVATFLIRKALPAFHRFIIKGFQQFHSKKGAM